MVDLLAQMRSVERGHARKPYEALAFRAMLAVRERLLVELADSAVA